MSSAHYDRGLFLFHNKRHQDAASELRAAVAHEPEDVAAWGLLALTLLELERRQEAADAARRLMEIAPELDYSHYVLARVELDRGNLAEARTAIARAIELHPGDATNFGALAQIEVMADNWLKAVEAADQGLAIDPANEPCKFARTIALGKLGRGAEAEQGFSEMLQEEPNDPYTHDARGWFLLERGESAKAREHFIESLRLDPTNSNARLGLANALKARHRIFGFILQGLLYLGRFRAWILWLAVLGAVIGLRMMDNLSARFPDIYWLFWAIKTAFWVALFSIVVANPLFDLVLRFDREGRHALSEEQMRASTLNALCLVVALVLGWLWAWKNARLMGTLAMASVMLTALITNTFAAPEGWVRRRMVWLTLFAAALIPFSYVFLIMSVVLIVKFRWPPGPLLKAALLYIPFTSVLISAFSDNILAWLVKKRPDPRSA